MKMTEELWNTTAIHKCSVYAVFNDGGAASYWKRIKRSSVQDGSRTDTIKYTQVDLDDIKMDTRNELVNGWREYMEWMGIQ